jgi:hypothetical protein
MVPEYDAMVLIDIGRDGMVRVFSPTIVKTVQIYTPQGMLRPLIVYS